MRSIHYALAVLIGAYVVTIAIGATLLPFSFGQHQFAALVALPLERMPTLGSPLYWFLLALMLVVAPATAMGVESYARKLLPPIRPRIPLSLPLSLGAAMVVWCIYRLELIDALSLAPVWDRSTCYEEKIIRRMALISHLGTRYYCFIYSSLPVLGSYLLARGIKEKNRPAFLGCVILSAAVIWLDLATLMKTPALLYIGMLGLTLLLCGFGVIRSAMVVLAGCIPLYLALSVTQYCEQQVASWEVTAPKVAESAQSDKPSLLPEKALPAIESPAPPSPLPAAPPAASEAVSTPPSLGVTSKVANMARSFLLRMSVGFPYYVQLFSDPAQRCGIERPPLSILPERPCFPPEKVFRVIYPDVTYVKGAQPAPVNLYGYAEGGLWYAVIATAIAGAIIGIISAFGGTSPLSIAVTVAICIYSYYVSQVSLTGSIIDSYGLIWLILPLALIAGPSLMSGAVRFVSLSSLRS
jgi:hypothetical protein